MISNKFDLLEIQLKMLPHMHIITTSVVLLSLGVNFLHSSETAHTNLTLSSNINGSFDDEYDGISECTAIDNDVGPMTRNGLTDPDRLWKHLRYYLDGEYTTDERDRLHLAAEILHHFVPCVTFEEISTPLPDNEAQVVVERGGGCTSSIGRIGIRQRIVLSDRCLANLRNILHEFIHALGLEHEHNRPDRDHFVVINWDNIKPDVVQSYKKSNGEYFSTFGFPYNPRSIMHYGLRAYSSNGQPTITLKDDVEFAANERLTYREMYTGLQRTDIEKIRKMYSC